MVPGRLPPPAPGRRRAEPGEPFVVFPQPSIEVHRIEENAMLHRPALAAVALCLAAASLVYVAAAASNRVTDFADRGFAARDIVTALQPVRTRGLRLGDPDASDAPAEATVPKISLQLRFGRNSAELSADAKRRLDTVAAALNTPELADTRVVVSGHTDVTGSFEHNVALSQRRAEAVKAYLVSAHDVAADRLKAVGRGPNDLLDEAHPASSVNRRVQLAVAG
jgi:outer membrane protein OmpA-like peptidoglycan-associated protein